MMAARRIIYFLALLSAAAYYIFDSRYFSWALLVIVLCLPLISILATLPFLLKYRVKISCAEKEGAAGRECGFTIEMLPSPPISPIVLELRLENLFYGAEMKEKVAITAGRKESTAILFPEKNCGVLRYCAAHLRIRDFLGLFYLPFPSAPPETLLRIPEEIHFEDSAYDSAHADRISQSLAQRPSAGEGEREVQDIREYKYGDSLRNVHWKLTARFRELMVRDYEEVSDTMVYIAILWAGRPERLSVTLGRLTGAVRYMFLNNHPFKLLWAYRNGEDEPEIMEYAFDSESDFHSFLWDLLSKQPPSKGFSLSRYLFDSGYADKKNVLVVTHDDIQLYTEDM